MMQLRYKADRKCAKGLALKMLLFTRDLNKEVHLATL